MGVFSSYFSVSCPYYECCIDQTSEYSLLSNKLRISDVFHKMNSPIKQIRFAIVFAGALCNNLILNWIFFRAENALTLAEWLPVTMRLALSLISMRFSILSLTFSASYCPLNVTSWLTWLGCGKAWTTKDVDYFNRTTINLTIPLYKFLSLSTPDWYWSDYTRSSLRICTFINHFLKHKVVIFAELFKTYLWES